MSVLLYSPTNGHLFARLNCLSPAGWIIENRCASGLEQRMAEETFEMVVARERATQYSEREGTFTYQLGARVNRLNSPIRL